MKFILSFSALFLVANAQAATPVTGDKAKALIDALTRVGVSKVQHIEHAMWNATDVSCEYTPRGFVWAQCQLVDKNKKTNLAPIAAPAHQLFKALEAAGTKPILHSGSIESWTLEAKFVDCQSGYFAGKVYTACTIE